MTSPAEPDRGPLPDPVPLSAGTFAATLPQLLEIYTSAMGYPVEVGRARGRLWLDHARRDGFGCVIVPATHGASTGRYDEILGMAYGYTGAAHQWWHTEVARGLAQAGRSPGILDDYFELTELHVRPRSQGRGLGESLLRALLAPVASRQVLLSTPEGESRAWRLYRRLGFTDVLRQFLFTGDARPFAVLGRSLPL